MTSITNNVARGHKHIKEAPKCQSGLIRINLKERAYQTTLFNIITIIKNQYFDFCRIIIRIRNRHISIQYSRITATADTYIHYSNECFIQTIYIYENTSSQHRWIKRRPGRNTFMTWSHIANDNETLKFENI